jgi:serine/threonine-protein kinase
MGGTPFGRYRLIEVLGRGGMGEVWRAHDTAANNRTVAIKLLPPHLAQDDTFVKRFRREADTAAQLNNPHIIPIHNYGEIDGRLYVDMRLIEGRDLQQVLADGPLEPARAVRIIEQVAKALNAAHKIKLVHRDVKPSNVLLDEDDFAYLIDFGIARGVDQTGLTGTGAVIGSWHYMSPERLRAGKVDARSDIYALACVLYECLTGSTPYPGDNFEQQITAHLTAPPPRPSSTDPNVPATFDPVIATGMAKDPDNRYATTVELADAAHDAITTPLVSPSEPTLPADAPPPAPPSEPTLLADAPPPAAGPTLLDDQVPPPPAPAAEPARQQSAEPTQPSTQQRPPLPTSAQHREPTYGPQVTLPFTALGRPGDVAVDAAGNLYVTDTSNSRVLKLAPGSATQAVLPFTGVSHPGGLAVDAAGNLYVLDNNRVLKLAPGSATQAVLPFTGLNGLYRVAADTAGNLYVTDPGNDQDRVVKLAAGSATPTVLPFTGLDQPIGVAVDTGGDLYVVDPGNNRVLKLAVGSATPTVLPFTGLRDPEGVAVDTAGNLYVTDTGNSRVLELAPGSPTQTVLPFTGLNTPTDVAVDTAGNVYVADYRNDRVLKLPAG